MCIIRWMSCNDDDVIKWKHFQCYWSPVNSLQRPVTRSFDVFFDLRLNKRLRKQSWGWWFETPSRPSCVTVMIPTVMIPINVSSFDRFQASCGVMVQHWGHRWHHWYHMQWPVCQCWSLSCCLEHPHGLANLPEWSVVEQKSLSYLHSTRGTFYVVFRSHRCRSRIFLVRFIPFEIR